MIDITDISLLVQLLGEERVEKIKDEIAQIIIDRIKSDLDERDNYIFYPPEHQDMLNEASYSIETKGKKRYSAAILERVKKDVEKIVNQERNNDGTYKKKEAIELLSERYMVVSMCADKDYCIKQNAAIDMAISSLESDANAEEEYELLIESLNEKIESFSDSFSIDKSNPRAEVEISTVGNDKDCTDGRR